MKYPEMANPQRQKADQQLPGDGQKGDQEITASWVQGFLWGDENMLELDSCDNCTTL